MPSEPRRPVKAQPLSDSDDDIRPVRRERKPAGNSSLWIALAMGGIVLAFVAGASFMWFAKVRPLQEKAAEQMQAPTPEPVAPPPVVAPEPKTDELAKKSEPEPKEKINREPKKPAPKVYDWESTLALANKIADQAIKNEPEATKKQLKENERLPYSLARVQSPSWVEQYRSGFFDFHQQHVRDLQDADLDEFVNAIALKIARGSPKFIKSTKHWWDIHYPDGAKDDATQMEAALRLCNIWRLGGMLRNYDRQLIADGLAAYASGQSVEFVGFSDAANALFTQMVKRKR